jgi:protein tyrosine/serine phosphatase
MKNVLVSTLLFAGYLVGAWTPAALASGPEGVARFFEIHPGLYRGGQPALGTFQELKDLGIRTIINLRVDDSERKTVESLGMNYVHLPIAMPLIQRPWKRISDETLQAFLKIVSDPANQPVFVHCQRGADRTGAMIAMYRVAAQQWSADKAYSEARQIGMRWWYRAFKKQILQLGNLGE